MKLVDKHREVRNDNVVLNGIVGVFVLAVLCAFPVVVTDMYFNILITKYWFYCGCFFFMIVCFCVYLLIKRGGRRQDTPGIKEVLTSMKASDVIVILCLFIMSAGCYLYINRKYLSKAGSGLAEMLSALKGQDIISIFILLIMGIFVFLLIKISRLEGRQLGIKKMMSSLEMPDLLLVAFWLIVFISTVMSEFFFESFWGNEGRYSGLFLLSIYTVSYFCVSKLGKFKRSYLDCFLAVSIFVCLWGITDYFQLDIFGFTNKLVDSDKISFTSSLGNTNTYTAYVGMVSAVATVLYASDQKIKKNLFYFISMIISYFAIIMGQSDNAYLSLGALFMLLPLYLFGKRRGIKRYLIIISSFFLVAQCIDWLNIIFTDHVFGIDSIFKLIVNFEHLTLIISILWGLVGIWTMAELIAKKKFDLFSKWLSIIWLVLIVAVMGMAFYILYDCNISGNADKYAQVSRYIVFDDEWGTHRGYIWRNAIEIFEDFSPLKKIVGNGPDTFGILMKSKTADNPYHEIFDNAHNEYLHYLITIGIAGVLLYIGFLVSFIKTVISRCWNDYYGISIVFAVVCYSTQAVVNISLPIVTPIFWMMLALGKGLSNEYLLRTECNTPAGAAE